MSGAGAYGSSPAMIGLGPGEPRRGRPAEAASIGGKFRSIRPLRRGCLLDVHHSAHARAAQDDDTGPRIAKARAHPLRSRILERLADRAASPAALAAELGVSIGLVSYHLQMLDGYGCLKLARIERSRGRPQRFYRATSRCELGAEALRALPSGLRGELCGETTRDLMEDLREASTAGTLEDVAAFGRRLELDQRGRCELDRLARHARRRALAIAADSRRRSDGTEVFPTELVVLLFEPVRGAAHTGGGEAGLSGDGLRRPT